MQPNGKLDEQQPPRRVLSAVAQVLNGLIQRNDKIISECDPTWCHLIGANGLEVFNGVHPPSISISKYIERIHRYASCSPSCFVVAFVYIDRAIHRRPGSMVVSINVHRLILTSVMIASKFLDDTHHNNAFYARVGGVSKTELNRLEVELLLLLDFDVTVSLRVFESYCLHLEKEMMWNGVGLQIERRIVVNDVIDDDNEQPIDDASSLPSSQLIID